MGNTKTEKLGLQEHHRPRVPRPRHRQEKAAHGDGQKGQRLAEKRLAELIHESAHGVDITLAKAPVGEFLQRQLQDHAANRVQATTLEGYRWRAKSEIRNPLDASRTVNRQSPVIILTTVAGAEISDFRSISCLVYIMARLAGFEPTTSASAGAVPVTG